VASRSGGLPNAVLYGVEECAQVEWLGKDGRGAQVGRAHVNVVRSGQNDDGNMRRTGAIALRRAEGLPVHDRHHQVEHDQIRQPFVERVERSAPIRGDTNRIPLIGQCSGEGVADQRVVIDNQDATRFVSGHLRDLS
jgi:hypothetical protein